MTGTTATISPSVGGSTYQDRYFSTTGAGGTGHLPGHEEFSDNYYHLASPGSQGYPLTPYHHQLPPHRHYRNEPQEITESYQDDLSRQPSIYYPPSIPQPPVIYVNRPTTSPGSPQQVTVFSTSEDARRTRLMADGIGMDHAGSAETKESPQLEQNSKEEMYRKSPQALLTVHQQPHIMGEIPSEESSRGSRSSMDYMIIGDDGDGQDQGKGKLVDGDDVSTSAVTGVIRIIHVGEGSSSDDGHERNASSEMIATTTLSTRTDGEGRIGR
ncbi:hypothetical protein BGX31_001932 [Mortierella sp. GBA43]|nr:hypothetical protein BGX31_001932 [Mortierella sp. GBA43]